MIAKQTVLSRFSNKVVTCRAYGHAWAPKEVLVTRAANNRIVEYTSVLSCARCKTDRRTSINPRGEILRNGYKYSTAYLVKFNEEKFDRGDVRIEYMRRTVEEFEEEAS